MVNGHLRQRKNKDGTTSWQIVLEEEASGGKRNRSYHTVRGTKKQAEIIKRKLIADMEAGNILAPSTKKLEDWMWEWLQLYKPNIETSTRIGYTEKIKKYIVPELGHIPLQSLQASNVQSWVNKLSKENALF